MKIFSTIGFSFVYFVGSFEFSRVRFWWVVSCRLVQVSVPWIMVTSFCWSQRQLISYLRGKFDSGCCKHFWLGEYVVICVDIQDFQIFQDFKVFFKNFRPRIFCFNFLYLRIFSVNFRAQSFFHRAFELSRRTFRLQDFFSLILGSRIFFLMNFRLQIFFSQKFLALEIFLTIYLQEFVAPN